VTRREQDTGASRGHWNPPGRPTGSPSYDDVGGGPSDDVIDIVAVVAAIVILTLTALAC